jgi:uncharacterized protein
VALFSTIAGLLYGMWKDGTGLGLIALYCWAFVALLALGLTLAERRTRRVTAPARAESRS